MASSPSSSTEGNAFSLADLTSNLPEEMAPATSNQASPAETGSDGGANADLLNLSKTVLQKKRKAARAALQSALDAREAIRASIIQSHTPIAESSLGEATETYLLKRQELAKWYTRGDLTKEDAEAFPVLSPTDTTTTTRPKEKGRKSPPPGERKAPPIFKDPVQPICYDKERVKQLIRSARKAIDLVKQAYAVTGDTQVNRMLRTTALSRLENDRDALKAVYPDAFPQQIADMFDEVKGIVFNRLAGN